MAYKFDQTIDELEKVPWEAHIPPASSHQAPPPLPPTHTTQHMLTPDIKSQIPNTMKDSTLVKYTLETRGPMVL